MTHAHYEPYDPRGTKTPIHTGNTVDKHGGKIREHREKYTSTGGNTGARGENMGERGKYLLLGKGTFMTPIVEPYVTGFAREFGRLNFVDNLQQLLV